MFAPALPVPLTLALSPKGRGGNHRSLSENELNIARDGPLAPLGRGLQFARNPSRQHLLPLLFTYSAAKQFPIPGVYLANIHQCDRFLSRIYGNA
ncbi:hypothetical protein DTY94_04145 [Escherichia coli]|nr:hypothetical protein [Shigella boydii]EAB8241973.1 hypothetical protein [Escherichia coli]EGD4793764.1 hypothetical protein [Escherichia coli]EGD4832026.1 hypothetical protein [Escherichia coli]EGD4858666.1 hypothetical protein [Escherichia coli]